MLIGLLLIAISGAFASKGSSDPPLPPNQSYILLIVNSIILRTHGSMLLAGACFFDADEGENEEEGRRQLVTAPDSKKGFFVFECFSR